MTFTIRFYGITTHLIYRIYNMKKHKSWCPTNDYRSTRIIGYNPTNVRIMFYSRLVVSLPIDFLVELQLVSSRLPFDLLLTSCKMKFDFPMKFDLKFLIDHFDLDLTRQSTYLPINLLSHELVRVLWVCGFYLSL
jgi:hypothetical protein